MSGITPLLSVRNVGLCFKWRKSLFTKGSFEALKDVSFDLHQGDSLGVIGRNGAGKSTLLRLLGGIFQPDTGKIMNYNATTALLALQIGFDEALSGRVNAIVSGMLLGFRTKEVKEQLDSIIEFSGLAEFIDQPVKNYSAGMRARLGFAVALKMNPDVLLIDEALGVGDVEFKKKSMDLMKEKLLSEQTIVLVSHDANIVKNLCNRAVWIEDGVSRMEGESAEIVTAYEMYLAGRFRAAR